MKELTEIQKQCKCGKDSACQANNCRGCVKCAENSMKTPSIIEEKSKFKPFNAVIQVCPNCRKVDVVEGHEKECDPIFEAQRRLDDEYYD